MALALRVLAHALVRLRDLPARGVGRHGSVVAGDLTPLGGDVTVEVEGMDLAVLEGELLKRNEVYFDRATLLPLMASRSAA